MKLTMTRVLTPLAALAFTFSAQAALPPNEGFEGAQLDASWTFVPGTDSAPDASAITAYGDDAKPADSLVGTDLPGLPDGFTSDGNNYLKLSTEDGTLFRNLGEDVGTGLYLDTVVQFTVTDADDKPTPTGEDKFIIWLESDASSGTTNLCCFGGEYMLVDTSDYSKGITLKASHKKYTLVNDNVEIAPGSWHRLTVKAVSNMFAGTEDGVSAVPAFQVYVDGYLMESSENMGDGDFESALGEGGFSEGFVDIADSGEFIPSMLDSAYLSKIGFSGEGKLDDVVITRSMPNVEPHDTVTFSWSSTMVASISPRIGGDVIGTFTESPVSINVPVGATVTLAAEDIEAAEGYNQTYFDLSGSSAEFDGFTPESGLVTVEFGEVNETCDISLDIAYTLSYSVTVDYSELSGLIGEESADASKIANIQYTRGGETTTLTWDDLASESFLIEGMTPGESFTIVVNYKEGENYTTIISDYSTDVGKLVINGETGSVTIPQNYTGEEPGFGITLTAAEPAAKLFKIGETEYTLAELAEAMAGEEGIKTSADEPLTLLDDVELESGIAIAADTEQWLDLAGNTLTGPAEGVLFSVAGTLNIVDSGTGGAVVADVVASVDGTLNLTAGAYTGTFEGDGEIYITGGTFSADVAGATFDVGYGLVFNEGDEVYEYAAKIYTIKYNGNGGDGNPPADTTFTIEAAGTIGDNVFTAPANKTFNGWNTATDGSGTAYAAGAATPEVTKDLLATITLYAQWVDAATPLKPGEQDTTEYDNETAAKEAAASITIAAAPAVVEALTAEGALADYLGKFEVKTVQKGDKWVNEVALKSDVVETLQTEANGDAAAVLDDTATEITTTPGFYYSLKQGGTLDGMAEGTRVLATGSKLGLSELGLNKEGTAGFYKILINVSGK